MSILKFTVKIIIVSDVEDTTKARKFSITVPSFIATPTQKYRICCAYVHFLFCYFHHF